MIKAGNGESVAKKRKKLFAELKQPLEDVQDYRQGKRTDLRELNSRRRPRQAALKLLAIAMKNPEALLSA